MTETTTLASFLARVRAVVGNAHIIPVAVSDDEDQDRALSAHMGGQILLSDREGTRSLWTAGYPDVDEDGDEIYASFLLCLPAEEAEQMARTVVRGEAVDYAAHVWTAAAAVFGAHAPARFVPQLVARMRTQRGKAMDEVALVEEAARVASDEVRRVAAEDGEILPMPIRTVPSGIEWGEGRTKVRLLRGADDAQGRPTWRVEIVNTRPDEETARVSFEERIAAAGGCAVRRAPPVSFDFGRLATVPTRCLGCGAPSEHRGESIDGHAVIGYLCPSCGGYIVVDTDPARWVDVVDEGDEEEQS